MLQKIVLTATCLIFCVSCSPELDKKKFEKVYLAAKNIESATQVGVNYASFGDLLRQLSSKISVVSDTKLTEKEKELIKLYQEAQSVYAESYLMWGEGIKESWIEEYVGKGYIFVGYRQRPARKIAEKYNIPITNPRKSDLDVIPASTTQWLWNRAAMHTQKANNVYLGK